MAANTQLQGFIINVFPYETRGNFTKRVLWLKEGDRQAHPQQYEIEFLGEDGKRLDAFKPGQEVVVDCEVRGRLWEPGGSKPSKVFVSLKATGMRAVTEQPRSYRADKFEKKKVEEDTDDLPDDDGLPF